MRKPDWWVVSAMMPNGRMKHLGRFDVLAEATAAAREAERNGARRTIVQVIWPQDEGDWE